MHVIGTAGHVDHGKSALVQALTGIDPDRLQEEKERGMTIDLGFAWLPLPSGEEVSIVDVPGHERFIKNMLAGVGGIDLALLVVAADEGVMPQTREHLAILDLLGVPRGIGVITKADLTDPELLAVVQQEVQEVLKGTSLEGAPLVVTSARTGQGLKELVGLIDALLRQAPSPRDLGRPRLPIDRAFTISGFGTVVTGTLIDGSLRVGDEVEIVPGELQTRVRGLQSHRHKVEAIGPGTRTAVNIVGIEPEQVRRGQVLTRPGWLHPTIAVDVSLRMVADLPSPLRHNQEVTFHSLAAEAEARVRLLDAERLGAGESSWAQLLLDQPIALVKGDLFILRSTAGTLGGGEVVEADVPRHRRRDAPTLRRLESMAIGTPGEVLLQALETLQPADLSGLARQTALDHAQAREALQALVQSGDVVSLGAGEPEETALLYTRSGWQRLAEHAASLLAAHHREHPLRRGAPREEVRSQLRISSAHFPTVLKGLRDHGAVEEEGNLLRLPSYAPRLNSAQERQAQDALALLAANPYSPPSELTIDPEVLAYLAEEGKVVRVSEDVVFARKAYDEMLRRITERLQEAGKITVAEVRDMFGTSRKYALALMEHLDQQRVTRRVGDERVLR